MAAEATVSASWVWAVDEVGPAGVSPKHWRSQWHPGVLRVLAATNYCGASDRCHGQQADV
jgi:hypothetical protein